MLDFATRIHVCSSGQLARDMVRKLKYHEQKLLKKVDFVSWKTDSNIREVRILRKYHIQKRDDYTKSVESILDYILFS